MRSFLHFIGAEKHHKVQVTVTTLTIVGACIGILFPDYAHASILAGVATNLVWVWE